MNPFLEWICLEKQNSSFLIISGGSNFQKFNVLHTKKLLLTKYVQLCTQKNTCLPAARCNGSKTHDEEK